MTASLVLPRLEPVRIGPEGLPELTLGWEAIEWSAAYLRQPDGPNAGEPWEWTNEQARFVLWWYAIDEHGRFIYRRGMYRRLKGHGKDPVGAALCAIELCGPCRFAGFNADGDPVSAPHPSPWVVTAAVSLDQTRNTMSLFPSMFSDEAHEEFRLDIGKERIFANGDKACLQALAQSARASEGKRLTFALKNETHHWVPSNGGDRMAQVLARNLAKARGGDARSLAISNAHNPGEGSDAEKDYEAYLSMLTGAGVGGFLYDSLEAPMDIDMSDVEQVKAGIVAARGDSTWLDVDHIAAVAMDPVTGEGDARRFYFNQIIAGEDIWLVRDSWDKLAEVQAVPPKTSIVVGFDGSDTDDWTVIRAETVDGYMFTPTFPDGKPMIWNPAQHGGYIPRQEVHAAVAHLFKTYKVERMYCDPPYFQSEIDVWAATYGEKVVLRYYTQRPTQMAECLERFRTDVLAGHLKHDKCMVTSKHIENAQADRKPQGVLIRKDKKVSVNKIDAVMSSALAHEAAFDAKAAGWGSKKRNRVIGRVRGY